MNQVRIEKPLGDYKPIPISLIKSGGSREVFEDIASLAETIRTHGLLEPIIVKRAEKGNFFVVVWWRETLESLQGS